MHPTHDLHPIKLVTFDLYDTLIELKPPRWQRLATALARNDIEADLPTLLAADRIAEDFYTEENGRLPIRDRSKEEQLSFRVAHMVRWLEASGLPHDIETASRVRRDYIAEFEAEADGGNYEVFSDVMPALAMLREAGVMRAVISNADADVTALCTRLEFAHEMDVIVTSALVGWEKPDARTFYAALDPLGVQPADALHIGDQPGSDVRGAVAIGMRAALIDRYDRHGDHDHPALRVRGLLELAEHVIANNRAAVGNSK